MPQPTVPCTLFYDARAKGFLDLAGERERYRESRRLMPYEEAQCRRIGFDAAFHRNLLRRIGAGDLVLHHLDGKLLQPAGNGLFDNEEFPHFCDRCGERIAYGYVDGCGRDICEDCLVPWLDSRAGRFQWRPNPHLLPDGEPDFDWEGGYYDFWDADTGGWSDTGIYCTEWF